MTRPLAAVSTGLEHRDETTEEQAPTEHGREDNSCVGADGLPDDAAKIYVSLSDDEEMKEAVNPITDYDDR